MGNSYSYQVAIHPGGLVLIDGNEIAVPEGAATGPFAPLGWVLDQVRTQFESIKGQNPSASLMLHVHDHRPGGVKRRAHLEDPQWVSLQALVGEDAYRAEAERFAGQQTARSEGPSWATVPTADPAGAMDGEPVRTPSEHAGDDDADEGAASLPSSAAPLTDSVPPAEEAHDAHDGVVTAIPDPDAEAPAADIDEELEPATEDELLQLPADEPADRQEDAETKQHARAPRRAAHTDAIPVVETAPGAAVAAERASHVAQELSRSNAGAAPVGGSTRAELGGWTPMDPAQSKRPEVGAARNTGKSKMKGLIAEEHRQKVILWASIIAVALVTIIGFRVFNAGEHYEAVCVDQRTMTRAATGVACEEGSDTNFRWWYTTADTIPAVGDTVNSDTDEVGTFQAPKNPRSTVTKHVEAE